MTEDAHILVVDDDDRLRTLLKRFLVLQGYRVSAAPSAWVARRLMKSIYFDLLIVDIMMPEEGGLSFLAWTRAEVDIPVILLTARDLPSDRIEGLKRGADDYLTKPFEPEELALRVHAILRRMTPAGGDTPQTLHLSGLVFDPARGLLLSHDKPLHLTESERQLLSYLAKHAGQTVDRQVLAAQTATAQERSIDVQVTRLRKKIEPDPREPIHLQTVRGIGYRLMPD